MSGLPLLAAKLPPLRPLLIAVVAGLAVAAFVLQQKNRPRRMVRVEPRERDVRDDVEHPWGD